MSRALEFRIAQTSDFHTVLAVLRDAALWLASRNVDQWQNYIQPDDDLLEWIEQGIADQEVFLVYRGHNTNALSNVTKSFYFVF